MAPYNGACLVNLKKSTFLSSAMTKDRGAFDGVPTAAHELGHLYVNN